ncbi:hypothetical protein V5799_005973, partial [Amblyomma americanum]
MTTSTDNASTTTVSEPTSSDRPSPRRGAVKKDGKGKKKKGAKGDRGAGLLGLPADAFKFPNALRLPGSTTSESDLGPTPSTSVDSGPSSGPSSEGEFSFSQTTKKNTAKNARSPTGSKLLNSKKKDQETSPLKKSKGKNVVDKESPRKKPKDKAPKIEEVSSPKKSKGKAALEPESPRKKVKDKIFVDEGLPLKKGKDKIFIEEQSPRKKVKEKTVVEQELVVKKGKEKIFIVEESPLKKMKEKALVDKELPPKKGKDKILIVEESPHKKMKEKALVGEELPPKKGKNKILIVEESPRKKMKEKVLVDEELPPKKGKDKILIVEESPRKKMKEKALVDEELPPMKGKDRILILEESPRKKVKDFVEKEFSLKKGKDKIIIVEEESPRKKAKAKILKDEQSPRKKAKDKIPKDEESPHKVKIAMDEESPRKKIKEKVIKDEESPRKKAKDKPPKEEEPLRQKDISAKEEESPRKKAKDKIPVEEPSPRKKSKEKAIKDKSFTDKKSKKKKQVESEEDSSTPAEKPKKSKMSKKPLSDADDSDLDDSEIDDSELVDSELKPVEHKHSESKFILYLGDKDGSNNYGSRQGVSSTSITDASYDFARFYLDCKERQKRRDLQDRGSQRSDTYLILNKCCRCGAGSEMVGEITGKLPACQYCLEEMGFSRRTPPTRTRSFRVVDRTYDTVNASNMLLEPVYSRSACNTEVSELRRYCDPSDKVFLCGSSVAMDGSDKYGDLPEDNYKPAWREARRLKPAEGLHRRRSFYSHPRASVEPDTPTIPELRIRISRERQPRNREFMRSSSRLLDAPPESQRSGRSSRRYRRRESRHSQSLMLGDTREGGWDTDYDSSQEEMWLHKDARVSPDSTRPKTREREERKGRRFKQRERLRDQEAEEGKANTQRDMSDDIILEGFPADESPNEVPSGNAGAGLTSAAEANEPEPEEVAQQAWERYARDYKRFQENLAEWKYEQEKAHRRRLRDGGDDRPRRPVTPPMPNASMHTGFEKGSSHMSSEERRSKKDEDAMHIRIAVSPSRRSRLMVNEVTSSWTPGPFPPVG